MKKTIFCLSVFLLTGLVANAQLTKIGGSLAYNSGYYFNDEQFSDHKTGNPVVSATGIYEISLPLHIKPSLNIYIPNITKFEDAFGSEKRIVSAFSLDLDAHYVFNALDRWEFYGLAGLNILYARMKYKIDFENFAETTITTNNSLGLNLGAGSYFRLKDEFDLFFEVKAIIASQVRFAGTAGILLNVDWMKKHESDEL